MKISRNIVKGPKSNN